MRWYWHANFIRLISISFFKPLYSTVELHPRGITDGTAIIANLFETGSKKRVAGIEPATSGIESKV